MNNRTKKDLVVFVRYLTRIGLIRGLILYFKLHILHLESAVQTGFLEFPVYLRKGTTDLATFDQIFVSKIYDLPLKFVPETIIDCGANVGMASIYFANKFPNSKIIAIEPEPSNFEVLQENCKPYANISVLRKAIWHTSGSLKLFDSGTGHYGFAVREVVDTPVTNDGMVDAITVGGIMSQFSMNQIDLLKIDIEGAEKELFSMNYEDWLPRTRALTIEIHDRFKPGSSKAVIKAVARYNFSVSGSFEGFFCNRDA